MLSVTVNDLITQARKANGSLGDGIVMSAEEVQDDMMALNIMLAEWSAVGLGVYVDTQEMFTLTPSKVSYTWGSTAIAPNFTTSRPTEVRDQTFIRVNNVDYPVRLVGQAEYASISTKQIVSSWPDTLFFDNTYPLAVVYLYPIPDAAYQLWITSSKVLDSFTVLTANMNLPQEYASAIKWSLACELASNYNVTVTPMMLKRAKESLNTVKNLTADQRLEQVKLQVTDLKPSIYLRNLNDAT